MPPSVRALSAAPERVKRAYSELRRAQRLAALAGREVRDGLAACARAGFSVDEIALETGLHPNTIRSELKKAARAGQIAWRTP